MQLRDRIQTLERHPSIAGFVPEGLEGTALVKYWKDLPEPKRSATLRALSDAQLESCIAILTTSTQSHEESPTHART